MKKINKPTARKLYRDGKHIFVIPCNCYPCKTSPLFGEGFEFWKDDPLLKQWEGTSEYLTFDQRVRNMEHHNCNHETGYYAAYYLKDSKDEAPVIVAPTVKQTTQEPPLILDTVLGPATVIDGTHPLYGSSLLKYSGWYATGSVQYSLWTYNDGAMYSLYALKSTMSKTPTEVTDEHLTPSVKE